MEFENQEEEKEIESEPEVLSQAQKEADQKHKISARKKVKCEICGKELDPRGLKLHMKVHKQEDKNMEAEEKKPTASKEQIEIIDSESKIPKSGIDKVIDFLSKPEILPLVIAGAGALALKLQQGPGIRPGTNPNDPPAPPGYHYETVQSGAKVLCKDGF